MALISAFSLECKPIHSRFSMFYTGQLFEYMTLTPTLDVFFIFYITKYVLIGLSHKVTGLSNSSNDRNLQGGFKIVCTGLVGKNKNEFITYQVDGAQLDMVFFLSSPH